MGKKESGRHAAFYLNACWQYGLQVIKYIFPLITLPYLTRVLEPEGYAVYAYVVSFMTFVQAFVDFGFNLSGTKLIASSEGSKDKNEAVGAVTEARLILCLAAAIIVFVVAQFIPLTRMNMPYTMLAFIAVCGKALAPDFIFMGQEQMGPITTRYLLSKGISTALTFVLVHSITDILWIPILDIVSSVVALIWSFQIASRRFGIVICFVELSKAVKELKQSALYCFSNMAASVFTGFTTLLIGVVVKNTAEISYWSLSMTAVGAVQSLYAPIVNSLYPHMVKNKDFSFAKQLLFVAVPVVMIGTVAFALLSRTIMGILGGPQYLEGSWVVTAVSPVLFFSFFATFLGWPVLGAAGRVKELTMTTVVSSLFCIGALLALSLFGLASVLAVCAVRVFTEMILFGSRVLCCWKIWASSRREVTGE